MKTAFTSGVGAKHKVLYVWIKGSQNFKGGQKGPLEFLGLPCPDENLSLSRDLGTIPIFNPIVKNLATGRVSKATWEAPGPWRK